MVQGTCGNRIALQGAQTRLALRLRLSSNPRAEWLRFQYATVKCDQYARVKMSPCYLGPFRLRRHCQGLGLARCKKAMRRASRVRMEQAEDSS